MSILLHSTRFGTVEIDPDKVIEFGSGLIGLGGSRYALLASGADASFLWLHSLDDGSLALPVTSPHRFFPDFRLELAGEDARWLAPDGLAGIDIYVTVCASPRVSEMVANLRAPIVIRERRGAQVINQAPGMALRAPLFPAAVASAA